MTVHQDEMLDPLLVVDDETDYVAEVMPVRRVHRALPADLHFPFWDAVIAHRHMLVVFQPHTRPQGLGPLAAVDGQRIQLLDSDIPV